MSHQPPDQTAGAIPAPLRRSYWVTGSLVAGMYPGSRVAAVAQQKVRALCTTGITLFLDLTDPSDDLEPYEQFLTGSARRSSLPVHDLEIPPASVVADALRLIDSEAVAGGITYVHCWGGIGRTGTIVGCWIAERIGGPAALGCLADLRRGCSSAEAMSPAAATERRLVELWPRATVTHGHWSGEPKGSGRRGSSRD